MTTNVTWPSKTEITMNYIWEWTNVLSSFILPDHYTSKFITGSWPLNWYVHVIYPRERWRWNGENVNFIYQNHKMKLFTPLVIFLISCTVNMSLPIMTRLIHGSKMRTQDAQSFFILCHTVVSSESVKLAW